MFSQVDINKNIDSKIINNALKKLYETNFFKDISINFSNNILEINVIENPILQNISYEGIKSNKIQKIIKDITKLRSRSSYNELTLKKDIESIKSALKDLGYFFPVVDTYLEELVIIKLI